MAKPAKSQNLSKKFLLGLALTALPLAGCDLNAPSGRGGAAATNQASTVATADEAAQFERARELQTVASAEAFLQTYPNSNLTGRLLRALPSPILRRINDEIVNKIDPSVIDDLPFRVKQALGFIMRNESSDGNSSDGYSG